MTKYYLLMLLSVTVASVSQILLKFSARSSHKTLLKEYLNIRVLCAYFLLFISTLLTIAAFRGLDYKNGPVLESLGYLIVMGLSRFVLGEKITVKKMVGNLTIVFGLIVFYA